MNSIFSTLANANVTGEGVKLPEGTFGVRITRCHMHRSQDASSQRMGHMLAIIEFEVTTSAHPSAQPGQAFSCVEDMNSTHGPGNVKLFLASALGIDARNEQHMQSINPHLDMLGTAVFDGRNLFGPQGAGQAGIVLGVSVVTKTAKASGRTYNRHLWFPSPEVPPQFQEIMGRLQASPNPVALPPPPPSPYAAPVQVAAPHAHWGAQPPVGPMPQGWPVVTAGPPPAPAYPPGYGAPVAPPPMPMGSPPGWPPSGAK